jgi:hypothetical protein
MRWKEVTAAYLKTALQNLNGSEENHTKKRVRQLVSRMTLELGNPRCKG